MKRRGWLLAAYLALLLASHLVRSLDGRSQAVPAGIDPAIEATVVGGAERDATLELAYREWGEPGRPAVLLLHGSPGSSRDFLGLAPLLADRYHLIAPDLPGFGRSPSRVPDYSIRAHADYAEQLLATLSIDRAHVLGFSMGGGVALELGTRAPDRIASMTLLASIGAQEFELLGSYQINHAIHGAQLAALTLLHEGVPHFGALDGSMLDRAYARNFYDTDQRSLRGILERLEVPTLVLHGKSDPLVPVEAAHEHHRLVPQSRLVLLDTDHFTIFRQPELLAGPLTDFLADVEDGTAPTRALAGNERLEAAARPLDPADLPRATGLTRLVWAALLALATLVSEDLASISAGILAAQGRIGLGTAIIACALGIFIGDLALYWVGSSLGRPWLRRPPLSWFLSEERLEAASEWFRRRGAVVILVSRFTPGMRLATYLSAGLLDVGFARFALYMALAVALWTPLLVGVSAWLGAPLLDWVAGLPVGATLVLPAFVILFWLLLSMLRGLATWRGRRLWLGRSRRLRHWEFWPAWLFYPPVVAWILWLGVKHRSLTLFTAANPALPEGGFVGESKLDILDRLPAGSAARYTGLPASAAVEERRRRVGEFLEEHRLGLPVALKPDVGERGREVSVARDQGEIDSYLEAAREDLLVQEFVAGPELGVFYVRMPDEESGRIFSITEKRLIEVVGDGSSTLERLILEDDRAVVLAPLFLRRHRRRLRDVPAAGESFRLVDVGTHCRGALFLDGERFRTPALEAAIDALSREVPGFYFGRYDLRAPSEQALRDGRDLRILELNGVSSEATHIYDPSLGLSNAYRTLFEQWRLAFEIGAQNRRRGVRPTGVAALTGVLGRWARAKMTAPSR